MAPLPVTLNELEGHFCCLNNLKFRISENVASSIYDIFVYILQAI